MGHIKSDKHPPQPLSYERPIYEALMIMTRYTDTHLQSFQQVTNDLTPSVGHSHDVLLLPGVAGSHGLGGGLSDGSVDQEEVLRRGSWHIRILVVEILHTLANRL